MNGNKTKILIKAVGFCLIVSILFSGLFFEAKQAQAQWLTKDVPAFFQRLAELYRNIKKEWYGEILLIALETAKKRILNMLVDDIVLWIQEGDLTGSGEGQKFVADWGRYAEKAGQTAVGDLAQELGAGFLCRPFQFQVQFQLQNRSFYEEAACTLDDIVGNVEDFMENFNEGGWLAYHESWKPQNNALGATIMALDQAIIRASKAKTAAIQEAQASQGFLGVKKCLEYTAAKHDRIISIGEPDFEVIETWIKEGNELVESLGIKCTRSVIQTPGELVGDTLAKAVGVDFDYIISAKELSQYAAAIVDALINRVIKEGVKAVKTSSQAEKKTTYFAPAVEDYIEVIQQRDDERKKVFLSRINESRDLLSQASTTLGNASTTNSQLIEILELLIACQGPNPNVATALEYASSTRRIIISQELTKVNDLLATSTIIKTNLENPNFPLANIDISELEKIEQSAHAIQLSSEALLLEIQNILATYRQTLISCQNLP